MRIDITGECAIADKKFNFFGKIEFDNEKSLFELYTSEDEAISLDTGELFRFPSILKVFGVNSQPYILYGCQLFSKQMYAGRNGNTTLTFKGAFSFIIEQGEKNKYYDNYRFSFSHIEHLFPLENFETDFWDKDKPLTIIKEKDGGVKFNIADKEFNITSEFDGISSSKKSELQITQKKLIYIRYPSATNIEEIFYDIDVFKKYIEYLFNTEIRIDNIALMENIRNKKNPFYTENKILYTERFLPYTRIKSNLKSKYTGSHKEFISGITSWFLNYKQYERAINIWCKTIYNPKISKEDRLIWLCQSFESLCQINKPVYNLALSKRENKNIPPNLKHYFIAISELADIFKGNTTIEKEYVNTKNVRDKYIHNNPQKRITIVQENNALELIRAMLSKVVEYIFGIKTPISYMPIDVSSMKGEMLSNYLKGLERKLSS